jgi:apolipoprotein N-acyltransferase
MTPEDLQRGVAESREYFRQRARYLIETVRAEHPGQPAPHLIVGSGVVHYRQRPEVFCGVINITPEGTVEDWYGKTHLVMFGEYIPILPYIPGLQLLVPPELGLKTGSGPKSFEVNGTSISPNVCIETAVERVTVNQLRDLGQRGGIPDVIVTVTNDGWFDDSSVIDHHRRCAQLVAVGCRRPILSAANNGPTAWIDSRGQIVDQIQTGSNGVLIATPQQDSRTSLYLRIGDWPARLCALALVISLAATWRQNR